ncbi:MAG TPA: GTPase HflX, partial [Polyangia bacterium]
MIDDLESARRAVLLAVQLPEVTDADFEDALGELGRLARTLGLGVVASVSQKRGSFHSATYVGAGKMEDLKVAIAESGADVVLVDHEISPSQARNLEKATELPVMDRTGVILEIFHR